MSMYEHAKESQCCTCVVVCRCVHLEGVCLCCESISVSMSVSGDWDCNRSNVRAGQYARMYLSPWHETDLTLGPVRLGPVWCDLWYAGVHPGGPRTQVCPHARPRARGGWGHTSYWCVPGNPDVETWIVGPCGFWRVHTCWCDSGVMARMGTSGSFLPSVPLSSSKLGDWDVNSGRGWEPGILDLKEKAAGRPDSWVLRKEETETWTLEFEEGRVWDCRHQGLEGGGAWGLWSGEPTDDKGLKSWTPGFGGVTVLRPRLPGFQKRLAGSV